MEATQSALLPSDHKYSSLACSTGLPPAILQFQAIIASALPRSGLSARTRAAASGGYSEKRRGYPGDYRGYFLIRKADCKHH